MRTATHVRGQDKKNNAIKENNACTQTKKTNTKKEDIRKRTKI